jgi:hypothetical protein
MWHFTDNEIVGPSLMNGVWLYQTLMDHWAISATAEKLILNNYLQDKVVDTAAFIMHIQATKLVK